MAKECCDEDVAIFCEKIARQLLFVAAGLEADGDNPINGGAADILGSLSSQCLEFAESFADTEKRCQSCESKHACLKLAAHP